MNVLLLDIETAPSTAYIWSLWREPSSTDFVTNDWYILCWAAKWLGDKKIYTSSLPDFDLYKKESDNDKLILEQLWNLLDKADIVIAHNGIKFDIKKINTRFIYHGILPPSPYRIIDTLSVAKSVFGFTSNKLNDIGKFLKVGEKIDTGGFKLWKGCLNGDLTSFKKMVKYNHQDVVLLEKVYNKMLPYIKKHPNISLNQVEDRPLCGKCGSDKIHYRGYQYTNVSKFRQYCCTNCGSWGRERVNLLDKDIRKNINMNTSI